MPSGSCSTSRSNCRQHSCTSAESSSQPMARRAKMLQTMGGKIAPRPSLPSNRSSIQRRQAATARLRSGQKPTLSHAFNSQSTPRKNRAHPPLPPTGAGPFRPTCEANNSLIPCSGAISRTGLNAHISDRGTIIVRDQADTRCRLTGNQSGSSTISGGTAGQWAYDIWPNSAR